MAVGFELVDEGVGQNDGVKLGFGLEHELELDEIVGFVVVDVLILKYGLKVGLVDALVADGALTPRLVA